jgi:hypothetical protein
MFPALYTLATSCTQHGVRQSCAFTLHVGSGSVFCSSRKIKHLVSISWIQTMCRTRHKGRKDGNIWRICTKEAFYVALCLFLILSSSFSLVLVLLVNLLMNMSFLMLLSVETDEKLSSHFLKLYTHLLNMYFSAVCFGD